MGIKITVLIVLLCLPYVVVAKESQCYGTTANGYLVDGVRLPAKGKNYVGYSSIARAAGRSYVHSTVRDIVVSAYKALESEQPNKVYKYAETGFENGGRFKPHKTHRNGLSVDFMTPVINQNNVSVHLPTHPMNKFGYNIEFNSQGVYDNLRIDYEAMAAHIIALHRQASQRGYRLWRVIFDPALQPYLYKTQYGELLKKHIRFSKRRSWVRHDEHYHIDFVIPCKQRQ